MYEIITADNPRYPMFMQMLRENVSILCPFTDFQELMDVAKDGIIAGSLMTLTFAKVLSQESHLPIQVYLFAPNDIDIWCYDESGFETYESLSQRKSWPKREPEECSQQDMFSDFRLSRASVHLEHAMNLAKFHKVSRVGKFNVIRSKYAQTLEVLLDTFDLDCVRIGYDISKNEFAVHEKAEHCLRTGEVAFATTLVQRQLRFNVLVPYIVIIEFVSSTAKQKYPVHASFLASLCNENLPNNHRSLPALSTFVLNTIWQTCRSLNINLRNKEEVAHAKSLGAAFDPACLQFYIPSSESVKKFEKYLPFSIYTFDKKEAWSERGGVLLYTVDSASEFFYLAGKSNKRFLCDEVDRRRMNTQQICDLLLHAGADPDVVFNIVTEYYLRGNRNLTDTIWGRGIVGNIADKTEMTPELLKFEVEISEPLYSLRMYQRRVFYRMKKYMDRGFLFKDRNLNLNDGAAVNLASCNENEFLWFLMESEERDSRALSRLKTLGTDFMLHILTFLPRRLTLSRSSSSDKQSFSATIPHNATHPVIIDTRIAQLMMVVCKEEAILEKCFNLSSIDSSRLRFTPAIFFYEPSLYRCIYANQMIISLLNDPGRTHSSTFPTSPISIVSHLINESPDQLQQQRKLLARIHDEETFYRIITRAVDDSEDFENQHYLMKTMLEDALKERNSFCTYREKTFQLWNLIGPVRDLANFVIFDTFLNRIYIASITKHINCYCAKYEEGKVHEVYNKFYGFDCEKA